MKIHPSIAEGLALILRLYQRALGALALILLAAGANGQNLVSNPGFETNGGGNSAPGGWTKDFNSYGAFAGAALSGSWGLHAGNSADSGGEFQDIATVPGSAYTVTAWAQNYASESGTSHLDVLTGVPGTDTFTFPNSASASTTTQYTSGVSDHSFLVGAAQSLR